MEEELRRAAFGDSPDLPVWPALASSSSRARWLAAVVLGGQGHYAAAATVLDVLRHDSDPVIASLSLSTRASHHRQLGAHHLARALDGAALARVRSSGGDDRDGVDAAGARADALLGLAADSLGAGRLAEARRLLARVETTSWRGRVRRGWVTAEIELASDNARAAVAPAEEAHGVATSRKALRHELKSALVLGTSLVVWGTPDGLKRGSKLVRCELNHSVEKGLHPLVWPSALVLAGRLAATGADAVERAAEALSCVLRRADPVSRRVAHDSPWMPTGLLRSGEPPNADPRTNFLTD
ncbi:tetratricopeptide repeat protein [Lentzea sp.]|uniref:tetratricopeptide repeat protein n=1 Tax=Lentzea sp. TaxID=56099 RepID=UPI002CD16D2A|nr:tetratricopeptide repeat protein [Lentzea sp.]HUQ62107.1 tetratricopeptide repeat protein [Lentzea sp.]